MLTLQELKDMEPHKIFATGIAIDAPGGLFMASTGKELRWVAVRGNIHDWCIYCHFSYKSEQDVANHGDKVCMAANIKKLVPCDDEAFKMYRY